jgi:16S rRNA (guanine527-N7)-methyltransferase
MRARQTSRKHWRPRARLRAGRRLGYNRLVPNAERLALLRSGVERLRGAFDLDLGAREAEFIEKATEFAALAEEWGARMDLTAARDENELLDLLFADALAMRTISGGAGGSWVDVGSGVGAPGIALALLDASISMTLVEPRVKRVAFLRTVLTKLELSAARVLRARSETLAEKQWDTAVARATMPPEEWLAEGARLARSDVWVLLARSDAPSLDGWAIDTDHRFEWPLTHRERRVVRYRERA